MTIEARERLLDELLALQAATKLPLISQHEVRLIREQWERDTTDLIMREMGADTDHSMSNKKPKNP